MTIVRKFRSEDFRVVVECYRQGFPEGHNDYTLARLFRWTEADKTTFVAEEDSKIVGVVIGLSTRERAWITGLTVLPESRGLLHLRFARLLLALISRFEELGYSEVYATTELPKMRVIARRVGAELVADEPNLFFDGKSRSLYRLNIISTIAKYRYLLQQ